MSCSPTVGEMVLPSGLGALGSSGGTEKQTNKDLLKCSSANNLQSMFIIQGIHVHVNEA